jgi:hypothetical protein
VSSRPRLEPITPADVRSALWRLTVAADEQGRGLGRSAVDAVAGETSGGQTVAEPRLDAPGR